MLIPMQRGIFLGSQSMLQIKYSAFGNNLKPGVQENFMSVFGLIVDSGVPVPLITCHRPFSG